MQKRNAEAIQTWVISQLSKLLREEPDSIDIRESFRDFGLSSVQATALAGELETWLGVRLSPTVLFEYPTIEALSRYLSSDTKGTESERKPLPNTCLESEPIAIIGMACHFPKANGLEEYWKLLREGIDAIGEIPSDRWDKQQLYDSDLTVPGKMNTKWGGFLERIDEFDPHAFGISPREAERMDPQHRILMEATWEALEDAGIKPERLAGSHTGVFVGISANEYSRFQCSDPCLVDAFASTGNALSIAANRISYFYDLRGPSVAIDSACSSSLVAVHLGCQSIRNGESSIALVGAANLILQPETTIAFAKAGLIASDGRCKVFDARADGYTRSEGVGVLVLKSLSQALADKDNIYALIRGSAVNQDGRTNGLTAPSRQAQEAVLQAAYRNAHVSPGEVQYVEAHGTGTTLGDPIEVMALGAVLGQGRAAGDFCSIGSVKSAIGHLEAAAGIAGLMKVVLALKHEEIPPNLHFKNPNPRIPFNELPLRVQDTSRLWPAGERKRLAGVSSFGSGGTNSHVVLEEAPATSSPTSSYGQTRPWQLLSISGKTDSALETATKNLADYLTDSPETRLDDLAYTLHAGRGAYNHRRIAVCRDINDAQITLSNIDSPRIFSGVREANEPAVVFMFPGVGDHYVHMTQELYENELSFRADMNRCFELLADYTGTDFRELLYPERDNPATIGSAQATDNNGFRKLLARTTTTENDQNSEKLNQTCLIQPALFAIEYSLARLLMKWGIKPEAMIGYSLGEYVAACIAGVFSLEDALLLVANRARMIQELPSGAMLAVPLSEDELRPQLSPELSLGSVNTPRVCVVSGPVEAVQKLESQLGARDIACRPVRTVHAFHSNMMEPLVGPFTELVQSVRLNPPQIPYISNVTGTWVTAEQVTDPSYWAQHLRQTVRFEQGIRELLKGTNPLLLEVGPGQTLSSFAKQHPECNSDAAQKMFSTVPYAQQQQSELAFLLTALGKLWVTGVEIDWSAFYQGQERQKLRLPTYPFEHHRYWFVQQEKPQTGRAELVSKKRSDLADWFYVPVWKASPLTRAQKSDRSNWLVFVDECSLGQSLAYRLQQAGNETVVVRAAEAFVCLSSNEYTIDPGRPEDYKRLFAALQNDGRIPAKIVHLWSLTDNSQPSCNENFDRYQELGFYSLIHIAQALADRNLVDPVQIKIVSSQLQRVSGEEPVCPEKATLLGASKVISQEHVNITCATIDVFLPSERTEEDVLLGLLFSELTASSMESIVAYRGNERFVQHFEQARLDGASDFSALRQNGVYLITGGLGGIGLLIAEYFAREVKARLVLTTRSSFPAREKWDEWLKTHGSEDNISNKISKLRAMEEYGAEVLIISADVSDQQQMESVIRTSHETFGEVHGIIHAAGILAADAFTQVQKLQKSDCERHFNPKVRGLYVLEEIAQSVSPDFVVLLSSISSLLGGLGFAAYSAANSFMDSFAHSRQLPSGTKWISVNLETWRTGTEQKSKMDVGSTVAEWAMSPEEGVEAFRRILSLKIPAQIVISSGDLKSRITQWVGFASLEETADPASRARNDRGPSRKLHTTYISASNDIERKIAAIWQRLLGTSQIGINDNFFDLGGNSLVGLEIIRALQRELRVQLTTVALFEAPTVSALAKYITEKYISATTSNVEIKLKPQPAGKIMSGGREIAIIAMNGRFPGADNVDKFWQNLINGVESVSFFSDDELLACGIDRETLSNPKYVKARPIIKDADLFDARFFGFSPREAELTDPQQRLLLQCAWEAMELAGYDAENYKGRVGVFAGMSLSTYWLGLRSIPEIARSMSFYQAVAGNDKDSLATSISYRLNLRGPSIAVQTHCSTSLVATHLACQSLLNHECDMALAGGVSVRAPQKTGYLYQSGGQDSPDGHTRTFDRRAKGTVLGDGAGIVVLKRLEDALADGDLIYAVIKGSAINNDGAFKVGFAAPSVEGQAEAIGTALSKAGVDARTISYVEAHGSATELGDPIEVAALTKAFRTSTSEKGFCAIGSAKSNVGHLDKAAGVTGLIKASLALHNKLIPPSYHFQEPNPEIDFENSPFYVNKEPQELRRGNTPLRVSVNSLGMGGTNAHLVLEEAPPVSSSGPSRPWQALMLSSKTASALENATANLAEYLKTHPESNLADVAFTLQVGRRAFAHRRTILCRDRNEAIAALESNDPSRILSSSQEIRNRIVTFMFPGLSDQYEGMAAELYKNEPVFQQQINHCSEILKSLLGLDLREVLYPQKEEEEQSSKEKEINFRELLKRQGKQESQPIGKLHQTSIAQPAVFVIEYALARLLMSWGIIPQALIGYSLGEFVAAVIADSLSLEDALRLVAARAKLIDKLPSGAMLAVPLSEQQLVPLIGDRLSIAICNGPKLTVVAGPEDAISELEGRLQAQEIVSRRLQTTHAFHSQMMEQVYEEFIALLKTVELKEPQIAYISNVTGTWVRAEEVTDPHYWARHMCQTVRFGDGLDELLNETDRVFIEIGPGQNLGSFVKQHPKYNTHAVISSMRNSYDHQSDQAFLIDSLRKLWLAGGKIDWAGFYSNERRLRLPLPTYPFERDRYWIEPQQPLEITGSTRTLSSEQKAPFERWFYAPVWKQSAPLVRTEQESTTSQKKDWLIFNDKHGIGSELARRLSQTGDRVIAVEAGTKFSAIEKELYTVNPRDPNDYQELLSHISVEPKRIVHLWSLDVPDQQGSPLEACEQYEEQGFYSLLYLAQALGNRNISENIELTVVSNNMQEVTGKEKLTPERATLIGPLRVIPAEYSKISCRSIDLEIYDFAAYREIIADELTAELTSRHADQFVAYRNHERWIQGFAQLPNPKVTQDPVQLRESGVYLITGGLGGIGLAMADHLANTVKAKLVLVGRSGLPPKSEWSAVLANETDQNGLARKIRRIKALESAGAEVLVVSADVADLAQMQQVVKQATEHFGTIHGVLHAAGVPGNGLIQLKTAKVAGSVLAPKVRGTLVLESALKGVPLDFLVLFSSISSITGGGPGQVDYCAANAFLDLYARANRSVHGKTISIDWCEWQWDAWQEGLLNFTPELQAYFRDNREKFGLTFEEGAEVLVRALLQSHPQVIVCTRELDKLLDESRSLTTANILQRYNGSSSSRPTHARPVLGTVYSPATGELESKIAEIWQNILGIEKIGAQDNFFDLGGNSLIGLQIMAEMRKELKREISSVALYEAPTVSALAKYLRPASAGQEEETRKPLVRQRKRSVEGIGQQGIAIVGMAGRFPGAANVDELWRNLIYGVESITFFSDEELLAAGVDPAFLKEPNYVKAGAVIDGIDSFDATLFGYSPREAEIMDPQHRLFLECSWEALENAGYNPDLYEGSIGVFAGSNISTYLLRLYPDTQTFNPYNTMMMGVAFNSSDSLTTKVSYKLNLKGPSVAVQTFCSTSAVAMHMACKSLQTGDSDMALAGGVRINVPQRVGYHYESGAIDSPDGHCRAFDAKGQGAVLGNGVAIVVLKRVEDAIKDNDHIYAVIKGSAINNDGSLKVGYTAPSVDVQAEAIATALAEADVKPDEISYVEAHGTGTEMGDPIEILALTKAFRTEAKQFCPIGSIKTNLGHLDRAAGAVSMIKTALALKHELIPPNLHFEEPNPNIDFENSPFYVNTRLNDWKRNGKPRRAAMNALGIGGTNVHFVLEEAPEQEESSSSRPWQLLLLSAKTNSALDTMTANMTQYLIKNPAGNLADIAYTLQVGRKLLGHRRAVICRNIHEATSLIEAGDTRQIMTRFDEVKQRPVIMMLSGVGDHYAGMTTELYCQESVFRNEVDRCCDLLKPVLGIDLRELIFAAGANLPASNGAGIDLRKMLRRDTHNGHGSSEKLKQTSLAQPAVFVIDYALAKLLITWGIRPQALVGYSLGEYVAACLAGVLSLEDALTVVAERARLIQALPQGAMLAISLPEDEVKLLLAENLDLAAVNGPSLCVVSGNAEAVAVLEKLLNEREIVCRRVETTHAFHSKMMKQACQDFIKLLETVELKAPQIPYVSNVTGGWIKAEDAADPHYWARHMCETVRFGDGIETLLQVKDALLLEVGPSQALSSLVKLHPSCDSTRAQLVVPTIKSQYDRRSDQGFLLGSIAKLWLSGVNIDWDGFYSNERRHRVTLPTYPFEHCRYWVEPKIQNLAAISQPQSQDDLKRTPDVSDWFYVPIWKQSRPPLSAGEKLKQERCWLLMLDGSLLATRIKDELEWRGENVVSVYAGNEFVRKSSVSYSIDPRDKHQFDLMLSDLDSQGKLPNRVVHLWNMASDAAQAGDILAEKTLALGFYSLMFLTQALGNKDEQETEITVISAGIHRVTGDEKLLPERATVIGPCRVIPQEYTNINCRNVDIVIPEAGSDREKDLVEQLIHELTEGWSEPVVAYRGGQRWVQTFETVKIGPVQDRPARIRKQGVYLITGGFGGIGLAIAAHLARTAEARLVLIGRKGLPPREEWQNILDSSDGEKGLKDRIQQVIALEAMGSEVLTLNADVSNVEQMREVIRKTQERFGTLNGVFHSAGVPGAGLIQLKTQEAAASVLAPKVAGTLALEEALKNVPVDLVVLISSMTAIVGGGPGQLDYCAANAFLDAYAIANTSRERAIVSIDWGEWQWDAWQEGLLGFDPRIAAFFSENRRKFGVSFEEGMDALDRILTAGFPNVVVSTREFNAFIRLCKDFTVAGILQEADKRAQTETAYPRPVLGTSYVAPGSEAETQIAAIWQELLRIEQIGIHDNFFELGGNSLLGIRLIGEMKKRLKVEMAMYVLYEAPTVSTMVKFIESQGQNEPSLDDRRSRGEMRRKAQQRRQAAHR